ncbi:MAG: NAD(P)/FAD-dependent oxidoreductase [Acidobacteriota bacterium]
MKSVVILGGGFAGINAAKLLAKERDVEVTLIDRSNHHLFQPLLYQVAMAGLSPADIAVPIRSLLARYRNVSVVQDNVETIDLEAREVRSATQTWSYDYLVVATGARHAYFGHDEWESHAPGLKTLSQATEIRRRVLQAFESAENESDPERRKALLTFAIVGGGPTGVELAGAIAELSRSTLTKDFRKIDPRRTRVVLIEAGPRILPAFSEESAARATRDLEELGAQVWTGSMVTNVTDDRIEIGSDGEALRTHTVLWAAGVRASELAGQLSEELDRQGRVPVDERLSLPAHPEVFVVGDLAHAEDGRGGTLPGVAPVAMQAGRYVARQIRAEIAGRERQPFRYLDKGQMATIGRSRAVMETGKLRIGGLFAWLGWLFIHIYYLSSFRNRALVLAQWAWSYVTFGRGARLIVSRDWRNAAD